MAQARIIWSERVEDDLNYAVTPDYSKRPAPTFAIFARIRDGSYQVRFHAIAKWQSSLRHRSSTINT